MTTVRTQAELESADLVGQRRLLIGTEEVVGLEPLARASDLEGLSLDETAVTDLGPVFRLQGLRELELYENPGIERLDGLRSCTSLRSLVVGPAVPGLEAIAELPHLRKLTLCGARGELDLGWLRALPELERLVIDGVHVDARWLADSTALQQLWLTRTDTRDLRPLANMKALEDLSITESALVDITPLHRSTTLHRLLLDHDDIDDIDALRSLTQVQRLGLRNNRIARLPDLGTMTSLQVLDLSNNRIEDVSGLGGVDSLTHLYLSDNRIGDLRPVHGLDSLRVLMTEGNPAPIEGLWDALPSLVRLDDQFTRP